MATLLRDTFNGTNGDSLSSLWTNVTVSSGCTLNIQSNMAKMSLDGTGGDEIIFRSDNNLGSADFELTFDYVEPNPRTGDLVSEIYWRASSSSPKTNDGYVMEYVANNGACQLYYMIAGSWTSITTITTISPSAGDTIHFRIRHVGTTLSFKHWKNGTPEPASWDYSGTPAGGPNTDGVIAFLSYNSTAVACSVSIDNVHVNNAAGINTALSGFKTEAEHNDATASATSSSFTPPASSLIVVVANLYCSLSSMSLSSTHTGISAWEYLGRTQDLTADIETYVWVATAGSSPSSGTVTVSRAAGTAATQIEFAIISLTGYQAVRQVTTAQATGSSLALPFDSAVLSDSAVIIGAISQNGTGAITGPSGFANYLAYTTSSDDHAVMYNLNPSGSTFTLTTLSASSPTVAIALEVIPENKVDLPAGFGAGEAWGHLCNITPFKSSQGNVYVVGLETTNGYLRIAKATNPLSSFTVQTSGAPSIGSISWDVFQKGNVLHMAAMQGANSCYYINYDMSTDTYSSPVTVSSGNFAGCGIAVRSDGTIVVVYAGTAITSYWRIDYRTSTDGGVNWSSATSVDGLGGGSTTSASLHAVHLDHEDRLHIFWIHASTASSTALLKHVALTSAGSLGTTNTVMSTATNRSSATSYVQVGPGSGAASQFNDVGTEYVVVGVRDGGVFTVYSGAIANSISSWSSIDNLVATGATGDTAFHFGGDICSLVQDPANSGVTFLGVSSAVGEVQVNAMRYPGGPLTKGSGYIGVGANYYYRDSKKVLALVTANSTSTLFTYHEIYADSDPVAANWQRRRVIGATTRGSTVQSIGRW